MTYIRDEALAARTLLAAMAEAAGLDDEDGQLVVASETRLIEAIEAALLANAEDAAHGEAIKAMVATLEARAARKATRIERRKGAILAAMEISGLARLELAAATVTVGKGRRKVLIIEEELIPAAYMVEKTTRTPDKNAIAEALLNKQQVPGCELSNTMPTLTVRTK